MTDQFNILDYTDGPLLKTGQTINFTPPARTTKDDGGFQRGIAGSKADAQYNVLTTGQYSGSVNITIGTSLEAHSNACVHDKVTSLMWSRNNSQAVFGATNNLDLLWASGTLDDIFNYCDQANNQNLSGFSDWRIPNINEYLSLFIFDSAMVSPYINATAFPAWTNGLLFSSTSRTDGTTDSLAANFLTTRINAAAKATSRNKVALVRLGID